MSGAWETSSGRPTDYTGIVEEMIFGFDSRIKDGEELIAIFKIKPDPDEAVEVDEDGYVTEMFTLGKNWKTVDGGETASGNRKFNKMTKYGRLIDHTITQLGSVEAAADFFDGDPTEARIWVGMHATWNEVNYPFADRENPGKMIDFTMNMPHEITKPGQKKGSGAAAKSGAKAATAKAATNGVANTVSHEDKLRKLAQAFDEHSDWVEQAMKLPGVADDDTLMARLADEAYYESLKA